MISVVSFQYLFKGEGRAKYFLCFISVPEIEIVDERDKPVKEKFYKGGSTIELKCIVRQIVGQAPEYIIWHHGNRMLNYDIERGGIRYS